MKILKKIGIGCLALVICFCSCFKFVNAYQVGFDNNTLNTYQTNFGSLDVSFLNRSNLNQTFSLPSVMSGVNNTNYLDYDYVVNGNGEVGFEVDIKTLTETNMIYDVNLFTRINGINPIVIDIYNFMCYFTENDTDPDQMFDFVIDTYVVDYEQDFDFTLEFSYLNPDNSNIEYYSEDQPISLLTDDHQVWYYDFNTFIYDFILEDYAFDGMAYLPHIRITINHLTSLNSSRLFEVNFMNINASVNRYDELVNKLNNNYQSVTDQGLFRWLINSIDTFLDFQIIPSITIGNILSITIGLTLLFAILKIFFGG